ncbi:MAG: ETC complex I subunit [Pseudomonadota bacterium]
MHVRIYRPSKTTMQSGRAKINLWLLEAETVSSRAPDPLMGWVTAADTLDEIKMKFPDCETAVAYAQKQGWQYTVLPVQARKVVPRNYADNFKT